MCQSSSTTAITINQGRVEEVRGTLLRREIFQINYQGKVISTFRFCDVFPVLSFKDLLGSMLEEICIAFDRDGDKYLGFCLWSGNVECYSVKVRDDLID